MADYKELLRRAVEALPENNGAARRAVYEKARAALVGQLRAINPPLAARDITTHRLQLEDCIRQVEQEASEAVIAGIGHQESPPPPVYFEPPPPSANRSQPALVKPAPQKSVREAPKGLPTGGTIEDIIAAANADAPAPDVKTKKGSKPVTMRLAAPAPAPDLEDESSEILPPKSNGKAGGRPLPSIVARAEAAKGRSAAPAFGVPSEKPYDTPRRGPSLEPRGPRLETAARGGGNAAVARQAVAETVALFPEPHAAAMSAVREVEVEAAPVDPQGAIDRAIATLDREARGDTEVEIEEVDVSAVEDFPAPAPVSRKAAPNGDARKAAPANNRTVTAKIAANDRPAPRRGREERRTPYAEAGFPRAKQENERGGLSAMTIFLAVFGVLLIGAGGAGYYAMSQGWLPDIGRIFASTTPTAENTAVTPAPTETTPLVASRSVTPVPETSGTPATAVEAVAASTLPKVEERLTEEPATAAPATPVLALAEPAAVTPTEPAKSEERLADVTATEVADNTGANLDPAAAAGSQSLLLEASDDGTTGAVPFSGDVKWSKGTDETGLPTLIGHATIPARNLGVDVLIRKNSDPQLPASHLMEINFTVSDGFIGGSVAGLPGVLLKNEELVQGSPLVGASARVVGNSFLFALSASPQDMNNNNALLTSRKWMDLALIYATGKRAIITLEKDAAAESLFTEVFTTWGATASN